MHHFREMNEIYPNLRKKKEGKFLSTHNWLDLEVKTQGHRPIAPINYPRPLLSRESKGCNAFLKTPCEVKHAKVCPSKIQSNFMP